MKKAATVVSGSKRVVRLYSLYIAILNNTWARSSNGQLATDARRSPNPSLNGELSF